MAAKVQESGGGRYTRAAFTMLAALSLGLATAFAGAAFLGSNEALGKFLLFNAPMVMVAPIVLVALYWQIRWVGGDPTERVRILLRTIVQAFSAKLKSMGREQKKWFWGVIAAGALTLVVLILWPVGAATSLMLPAGHETGRIIAEAMMLLVSVTLTLTITATVGYHLRREK